MSCLIVLLLILSTAYYVTLSSLWDCHDYQFWICNIRAILFRHLSTFSGCFCPGTLFLNRGFCFLKLSVSDSEITHLPGMFLPLNLLEYCIEPVTIEFVCMKYIFPIRKFDRAVLIFASYCPCGAGLWWYCGLTICLLQMYSYAIIGL